MRPLIFPHACPLSSCPHPQVQYVFSFSYGKDGEVSMATNGGTRSKHKFSTKDSKLQVGSGCLAQCLLSSPMAACSAIALLAAEPHLRMPALPHPAPGGPYLQGPTLMQIKYQVVRLMRMLVEVTNTLEQVGGRVGEEGSGAGREAGSEPGCL